MSHEKQIFNLNKIIHFLMKEKVIPNRWSKLNNQYTYSLVKQKTDLPDYLFKCFSATLNIQTKVKLLSNFKKFTSKEVNELKLAFDFYSNALPFTFKQVKDTSNKQKNFRFYSAARGSLGLNIVPGWCFMPSAKRGTPVIMIDTVQYDPVFKAATLHEVERGRKDGDITSLMIHEIGHGYGLDHVHGKEYDSQKYTAMSYKDYEGRNTYGLMPLDILTLQAYYGKNNNFNKKNTYYQWSDTRLGKLQCLWDASGIDQFDISRSLNPCLFDMRAGQFCSQGSLTKSYQKTYESVEAKLYEQFPTMRDVVANYSSFKEAVAKHKHLAQMVEIYGDVGKTNPTYDNFSLAYGVQLENLTSSNKGDIIFTNYLNNIINLGTGRDIIYFSDTQVVETVGRRRVHQQVKYGWGHDILYSSSGIKQIVLDVHDLSSLEFSKKGDHLIVKHKYRSKKSSLTVAHYNPFQHVILLRTKSRQEYNIAKSNFEKYMKQSLFNTLKKKGLSYSDTMIRSDRFKERVETYDQYTAYVGKQKADTTHLYKALAFNSL